MNVTTTTITPVRVCPTCHHCPTCGRTTVPPIQWQPTQLPYPSTTGVMPPNPTVWTNANTTNQALSTDH